MFSASDAYEQFMGRWSRKLATAFAAFAEVRPGRHGRGRRRGEGMEIHRLSTGLATARDGSLRLLARAWAVKGLVPAHHAPGLTG